MIWISDLAYLPINPLSPEITIAENLINQPVKAKRDRIDHQPRSYGSIRSGSSAPDTRVSMTMNRETKEERQQLHQSIRDTSHTSNSPVCTKLFSTCFGKK